MCLCVSVRLCVRVCLCVSVRACVCVTELCSFRALSLVFTDSPVVTSALRSAEDAGFKPECVIEKWFVFISQLFSEVGRRDRLAAAVA